MKIQNFFTTSAGDTVKLYSLCNASGFQVDVTDWGATLVSIFAPDRAGKRRNVLCGFDDPAEYEANPPFFGALVGRYANRIAMGQFEIDGKTYHLPINDNNHRPNTLHGGKSFAHRLWKAEVIDDAALKLTLLSPDGDAGFPGNLTVEVTYRVTPKNELDLSYRAVTDAPTYVSLTNHAYFNLNGRECPNCSGHKVWSGVREYLEVNRHLVPTGRRLPVAGTPYDLSRGRTFEEIANDVYLPIFYDAGYVLGEENNVMHEKAFTVISSDSGITLETDTDQAGLQFYTPPKMLTKTEIFMPPELTAFCLEAQLWPDTPHHPDFPNALLRPGETYSQHTVYRFGVRKN